MHYTRFYADENGESHVEELTVDFALTNFAPPAPPVELSAYTDACRLVFFGAPAGWYGDWHPAPRQQWVFVLAGAVEGQVSDGETRRFGQGDAFLLQDTAGKGHIIRVVGDEPTLWAVVQLE